MVPIGDFFFSMTNILALTLCSHSFSNQIAISGIIRAIAETISEVHRSDQFHLYIYNHIYMHVCMVSICAIQGTSVDGSGVILGYWDEIKLYVASL